MKNYILLITILILSSCAKIVDENVIKERDSLKIQNEYILKENKNMIEELNSLRSANFRFINDSKYYLNLYGLEKKKNDSLQILVDSLKIKSFSEHQFIKVMKYDRLRKYFDICNKNNSQWKFYKGWSTRVFLNPE